MNILLVYPKFPDSFWSFTYAVRIAGRKALLPPLGLLTVAAMLPEHWNKRVVDVNVRDLTDSDLEWADYVFLSGMAVQRVSAHEIAARCKTANKKTVGGGPLFTGEYALFTDEVDHFLLNEAEPVIKNFVNDMEAGKLKRIYRSKEYAEMTDSPAPLWKLIDLQQYATAAIQYTRGCPYDCDFCNVTALLGHKPRTKTSAQIIKELDDIYATGWRGRIFFVDDNLIGHRPLVKKDLLPALIEWQKRRGPIPFITQATINLADDPKLTQQMADAGFDTIFVGIETTDMASLEECDKGQNKNRDILANVKTLQRAGIEVQSGFIVGFDHDTDDTFKQQVDFIQKSGIVTAMVGVLQAPPGTRLIKRMFAEGRLRGHSSGNNTDGSTNIEPKMGKEKLRAGYLWLLDNIFSVKPAYQRIKTFLKEFRRPKIRRPIAFMDLKALLRASWYLGVLSKERFYYWGLLFWTLRHRPELAGDAVRLAVFSYHYRRIVEEQAKRPPAQPLLLESSSEIARVLAASDPNPDKPIQIGINGKPQQTPMSA